MRLSELYFKLAKNRENLTMLYTINRTTNSFEVSNLSTVNQILHELKQYDIFSTTIEELEESELFNISYSPVSMDRNSFMLYKKVLDNIMPKLDMLAYLYELTSKKLEDNTLCFSIPQNYDLKDLQEFSNNVTKALSQISNISKFKGNITFKGVESGSDWFYFVISSLPLLLVIEKLINIVKKVLIDGTTIYNGFKVMNIKTESKHNLLTIQKSLIKYSIENEEDFKKLSTEERNTIINACIMLSKEISKGTKAEIMRLDQAKSEEDILTDKTLESTIEKIKLLQEASQSQEPTENNAADKNSDHNAE